MPIKKIIILVIAVPVLILETLFLYNMYDNNQSNEVISDICFNIKPSDTIESVLTIASKQSLDYSVSDSLIEISKNSCTCKLDTKDGKVIKRSTVCKY